MLYTTVTTTHEELQQILQLQQENFIGNIDKSEIQSQGFVTVHHDLETLKQMHSLAPGIIIKDGETVVGYALTMLQECRQLIPILEPMFSLFDKLSWENKALSSYRFYVMGQVCIAKAYRGKGLFEQLYQHHKKVYQSQFDLIVTEIAVRNPRSLRAHEKIGFKTVHAHRDSLDEWVIVAWDWK
jgi:GNAT superfamily N-acetyltransferase